MPRDSRYPFFRSTEEDIVVPAGKVWLQGDNIRNSTDSRNYGPVPLPLITGRVFFKVRRPALAAACVRNGGHQEMKLNRLCMRAQVWPPSEAGLIEQMFPPPMMR